MHNPTDRIAHTTTFATAVVEHWLECEIAQWVHEGSIRRPISTTSEREREREREREGGMEEMFEGVR